MGPETVAERRSVIAALAAAAAIASAACDGGPRVSPWGSAGRPRLADYAVKPDLEAHLATIDDDARRLGLAEVFRVEAEDPRSGDMLVAVALRGEDAVGRPLHATRIASPWGVVLARGPLDIRDVRRIAATELLREVAGPAGEVFPVPPLSDLTRGGGSHVVLRSDRGALEVWRVDARAGTQLPVVLDVPATEVRDVDGDGLFDLAGRVPMREGDPLAPAFIDVATWSGAAYTHGTRAARAWHAARRDLARAARGTASGEEERLRRELEAAWHAMLAGDEPERVVAVLDQQRPSVRLRTSFDDHGRRIARIGR